MKKILSLVLALCMVLCMASFASAEDVPTVKVITLGNGQPDNYEAWIEKLNPYVEEKIGAKLDVECIGWGDWGSRRSVIINTNEPYDVIFGDSGNLRQDVAVGAYLDITDLLAENAPGLLELIPAGYWDACRVNGRIYGVPTYKDSSITQYFVWDVEVLKELGLEEDAKNCHTLEEATPLLQKIKDAKGVASFPLTKDGVSQIPFIFDSFGAGLRGIGVRYNDKEAKVVKIFEEEDVMAQLKTVRGWYESGIINADAPNLAEGPTYKACFLAQGWSLAAKTVWGPNMGKELVAYTYGPTILSNDSVLGSVNFVSVNSEHPDKALAYLNLINTDSKAQDKNTVLVWLYSLHTDREGNYVKKPMRACTGEEVCQEWLYHIGVPEDRIAELAHNACNTTTCFMPYINAFFQPRKESDRPKVVPDGAVNFAFIGQFAETPRDTIFTTEYSMRTGMESVYTLLNVDRGVPEVWGSKYDVRELLRACYYALDKKPLTDAKLSLIEKEMLHILMKKVQGTDVEFLLKESGLIEK